VACFLLGLEAGKAPHPDLHNQQKNHPKNKVICIIAFRAKPTISFKIKDSPCPNGW